MPLTIFYVFAELCTSGRFFREGGKLFLPGLVFWILWLSWPAKRNWAYCLSEAFLTLIMIRPANILLRSWFGMGVALKILGKGKSPNIYSEILVGILGDREWVSMSMRIWLSYLGISNNTGRKFEEEICFECGSLSIQRGLGLIWPLIAYLFKLFTFCFDRYLLILPMWLVWIVSMENAL